MDVGYLESRQRQMWNTIWTGTGICPLRSWQTMIFWRAGQSRFLRRRGIRVPEDVSVVGFDNRPICSFTEPKVATIQLPSNEMGGMAVDSF